MKIKWLLINDSVDFIHTHEMFCFLFFCSIEREVDSKTVSTGEDSIAAKEDPIRSVLAISRLVRFEVKETKIADRWPATLEK